MRVKSLYECLELPKCNFSLDGTQLACEALYIVNSELDWLKNTLKEPIEQCVVIFDCGNNWCNVDKENVKIMDDLDCFDNLLNAVQNLPSFDSILNTVIIDNLSVYYFELKTSGNMKARLDRLGEALFRVKQKYRCNLIVTGLDISFEKGYLYNISRTNKEQESLKSTFDKFTYLTKNFLELFDYFVANTMENRRISYNKSQNQWIGPDQ